MRAALGMVQGLLGSMRYCFLDSFRSCVSNSYNNLRNASSFLGPSSTSPTVSEEVWRRVCKFTLQGFVPPVADFRLGLKHPLCYEKGSIFIYHQGYCVSYAKFEPPFPESPDTSSAVCTGFINFLANSMDRLEIPRHQRLFFFVLCVADSNCIRARLLRYLNHDIGASIFQIFDRDCGGMTKYLPVTSGR